MAVIDLETLDADVVDVPRDVIEAQLDAETRDLLGIPGEEFRRMVRDGRTPDHPAADRLELLAEALNDTE